MKLIIDIPEQMYLNAKADMLCGADIIVSAIKNGIPQETATEFADRCRECGTRYGRKLRSLDKTREEIEKQEKWLIQAGYNAYNVDIAFDAIKYVIAESEG